MRLAAPVAVTVAADGTPIADVNAEVVFEKALAERGVDDATR
jgi:hypothetical protein